MFQYSFLAFAVPFVAGLGCYEDLTMVVPTGGIQVFERLMVAFHFAMLPVAPVLFAFVMAALHFVFMAFVFLSNRMLAFLLTLMVTLFVLLKLGLLMAVVNVPGGSFSGAGTKSGEQQSSQRQRGDFL